MLNDTTRRRLRRVIALINRKGGVGKTSVTANTAGCFAAKGYRVLLVDLDSQGNLGEDLGYRNTESNDQGMGLFNAIAFDKPLEPIKDVRPRLDVVPAGDVTEMLATYLAGEAMKGRDISDVLAQKLATVADKYDIIMLDCPPGTDALQTQALTAARWLLVPTQPDDGALQGLAKVAKRVAETRHLNPDLAILGVVLFPVDGRARRMIADVRSKLSIIMGDTAPVFTSTIRFSQAGGVQARAKGKLAIELAKDLDDEDPFAFRKATDAESTTERTVASAGSLARDYVQLSMEILQTLTVQEQNEKARLEAAEAAS